MSEKKNWLLRGLAIVLVVGLSFMAGYQTGDSLGVAHPDNFAAVKEAWNFVFEDYVEADTIEPQGLAEAAIEGMLERVGDPHAAYLDPVALEMSHSDLTGSYSGIGARVALSQGEITIVALEPGSPAEGGGLKPGDILLAVDGRPVEGLSLTEAVALVRGPEGSEVELTLLRPSEGNREYTVSITREEILVPSVSFEMREDIAYIAISEFTQRTDEELAEVLERLEELGASGIVLDLRNNLGGLLDSVIDVASRFISEGKVLSVRYGDGSTITYSVRAKEVTTDLPLIVLVNQFSASGSEVLAGALQDHGRAEIAGVTTYGKGSVNITKELSDGSGIYLSIARWLTPEGYLIEGRGITPDIVLEDVNGDAPVQWAVSRLQGEV